MNKIDPKNFILIFSLLYIVNPVFVHSQTPVPVIASKARIDTFHDRVEALGTLKANESVAITASITDTITRVNFDDGQRVAAGDILVEMTSSEEHALLEEELSTYTQAKKQLNRIEQLVNQSASTQALLDQQRRDYEAAKARLRQIESRLNDRLIIAPFAGVLGLRNISVGALVEPGDIITTLDDDSLMKLDFAVPETYLESIAPGLTIEAKTAVYNNRIFTGTISSIDSRVDVTSRSILARAILENTEQELLPGMLMSVQLLKNPREAVVIAEEALIPSGKSSFVFLIDENSSPSTVKKKKIIIGSRRVGEVEVVEGLSPGDIVVIHGGIRIRPGTTVNIIAIDDGSIPLSQLLKKHESKDEQ